MNEQVFQDCLERWNRKDGLPFWQELADKHNYSNKDKLRNAFSRERKNRGISGERRDDKDNYRHMSGKNADGSYTSDRLIEIYEHELNDEIALLKAHNFDPTKFSLVSCIGNMWHAMRKDDLGRIVQFQSKIRVEPIKLAELSVDAIAEFYKDKDFKTNIKFPKFTPSNKRVLEICSADWHLGSRFFDKNYSDLEELFPVMMSDIFHRIENDKQGFTQIVFALMGDIFHYENRKQQTERNQQVMDGGGMNPLEMFDVAVKMLSAVIERLLEYAPVRLVYVPGNHDGDSLYHLLCLMKEKYADVKTFSVDLGHGSRKWFTVGKNLIGLSHGEMSKKNKVHWLQNDAREEWGLTKYAEDHHGHWHHEEVLEHGGVKSRGLPAIAPTDFWHHRSGYVGAIRATMSFVWDETRLGWVELWQSTGM